MGLTQEQEDKITLTRNLRGMVIRGMYASMTTMVRSITFMDGTTDEFKIGWDELSPAVRRNWVYQADFINDLVQADAWQVNTDTSNKDKH